MQYILVDENTLSIQSDPIPTLGLAKAQAKDGQKAVRCGWLLQFIGVSSALFLCREQAEHWIKYHYPTAGVAYIDPSSVLYFLSQKVNSKSDSIVLSAFPVL